MQTIFRRFPSSAIIITFLKAVAKMSTRLVVFILLNICLFWGCTEMQGDGSLKLQLEEVDPALQSITVRIDGTEVAQYDLPQDSIIIDYVDAGERLIGISFADRSGRNRTLFEEVVKIDPDNMTTLKVPYIEATREKIYIAFMTPKTNPALNFYGLEMARGIWLAHKFINKFDYPYELEIKEYDNSGDADLTRQLAEEIAKDSSIVAVIGPAISSHAEITAEIFNTAMIVNLLPVATRPSITQARPYVFRAAMDDRAQGIAASTVASREFGAKRAAVIFAKGEGSEYSQTLKEEFVLNFENSGGQVVASESFDQAIGSDENAAFNPKPMLERIQSKNPEVVFLPLYATSAARIISAAREIGMADDDVVFLGGDGIEAPEALFRIAGTAIEGLYVLTHWSREDSLQSNLEFINAYESDYHQPPTSFSALAWDSLLLLNDALSRIQGSYTSNSLKTALASVNRFSASTFISSFNPEGTPIKSAVLLRYTADGSLEFVQRLMP